MSPFESMPPPGSGSTPQSMPAGPPAPDPDRGPGSRFGFSWLGLALLVGAAAVAILLIGPGGGDSPSAPFGPIADAAQRMGTYPGYEFEMSASVNAPQLGQSMRMAGSGVVNGRTQEGRLTMHTIGAPVGDFSMDEVFSGTAMYLQSSQFAGQLPNGATWMKVDLGDVIPDAGKNLGTVDPSEQFDQLQAVSSDARNLGREKVGGAVTTHYAATIDLNRQVDQIRDNGDDDAADELEKVIDANGQSTTPVDVWIDRKGLIRRLDMTLPFGAVGGEGATMSMSMEMSHFGAAPNVTLPPESTVFDATELAQQQLDQLSG